MTMTMMMTMMMMMMHAEDNDAGIVVEFHRVRDWLVKCMMISHDRLGTHVRQTEKDKCRFLHLDVFRVVVQALRECNSTAEQQHGQGTLMLRSGDALQPCKGNEKGSISTMKTLPRQARDRRTENSRTHRQRQREERGCLLSVLRTELQRREANPPQRLSRLQPCSLP